MSMWDNYYAQLEANKRAKGQIVDPLSAYKSQVYGQAVVAMRAKKSVPVSGEAVFYQTYGKAMSGQVIADVNTRFEKGVYPTSAGEYKEYVPRGILTKGTESEAAAKKYMTTKADETGGAGSGAKEGGGYGMLLLLGGVALVGGIMLKRRKR